MATQDTMALWFDENWMPVRRKALKQGWDALARRDQVLLAVGFLMDSCIGDGVWAIVEGVTDGADEGLTRRMPEALEAISLPEAAGHIREIVRLRAPAGSPELDRANYDRALDHWKAIHAIYAQRGPSNEHLILSRLYDWYQSQ